MDIASLMLVCYFEYCLTICFNSIRKSHGLLFSVCNNVRVFAHVITYTLPSAESLAMQTQHQCRQY